MNPLKDFLAEHAGGKVRGFALVLIAIGLACVVGAVLASVACTGPPADPCSAHAWSIASFVLGPVAGIFLLVGVLIFLLSRSVEREIVAVRIPVHQVHVDVNRVPAPLRPIFAPPPPRSALEAEVRGIGQAFVDDAQELLGVRIVTHGAPGSPVVGTCFRCGRPVAYGAPVCGACGQPLSW